MPDRGSRGAGGGGASDAVGSNVDAGEGGAAGRDDARRANHLQRIGTGETHVSLNPGLVPRGAHAQLANDLTQTNGAQDGYGITRGLTWAAAEVEAMEVIAFCLLCWIVRPGALE